MNGQDRTTDKSPLWPGYSEMLRGVMGRPPMEMDENLQKRALKEWTNQIIKEQIKDDALMKELQSQSAAIVDYMWSFSLPIQNAREIKDLKDRIRELTEWDQKRFSKQIAESKQHLKSIEDNNKLYNAKLEQEYTNILRGEPDSKNFSKIVEDLKLKKYIDSKKVSQQQMTEIIKAASFCTVCPSSIIPQNGMERARLEVESLAVTHDFEIPERGTVEFEECAILQCMFRHAQNIALNYFKHYETNPKFWDKNFPADFPFDRLEDSANKSKKISNATMYPYHTKVPKDWKNKEIVVNWSENELKRTLSDDIALLRQQRNKLKEIEKHKTENDFRKALKQRSTEKTKKQITEIENSIKAKLKTSLYVIRSHESGYKINVDQSIQENWKKCESSTVN